MPSFKAVSVSIAIVLSVVLIFSVQKAQAQQSQIGVFYLGTVLKDSKKARETIKNLETKEEAFDKKMRTEAEGFQKKAQELEESSVTLTEDAKNKKRADLGKAYTASQTELQKEYTALMKANGEAKAQVLKKVADLVAGIAKERGYEYVFEVEGAALFFHPQAVDITSEVIKGYDK